MTEQEIREIFKDEFQRFYKRVFPTFTMSGGHPTEKHGTAELCLTTQSSQGCHFYEGGIAKVRAGKNFEIYSGDDASIGDGEVTGEGGIAFKVPSLKDPQSAKLDILASALGGGESSILWSLIRNELNLVHYIDCRNWNAGDCGLFWISYVCEIGKGAEVERAIWYCINLIIRN